MLKKWIMVFFLCALCCGCAGQNKDVYQDGMDNGDLTDPPAVPVSNISQRPPAPSETPFDADDLTGYIPSRLTGLPIHEEAAGKRPVAVVINNIYKALPQSGIAQADLIYEVLAEGDITRLVAIFQDHDAAKIGPVRSARDYFVHFALNHDAIFVHHGGSPSGYTRIKELKIDHLDGMNLEGPYYWRDRTYPAWDSIHAGQTRPMEHSSYTNSEKIKAAIAQFGFRADLYEDAPFGFSFVAAAPLAEADASEPATTVKVPFSSDYTRSFSYDPATRLYAVSNRNGPHRDAETEESLNVSNILIQFVSMRIIAGDEAGRREVGTVGSGEGYLVTAGGYRPVKWSKPDAKNPTAWTFADGSVMRLNPGRTWICVFQDNGKVVFES